MQCKWQEKDRRSDIIFYYMFAVAVILDRMATLRSMLGAARRKKTKLNREVPRTTQHIAIE